jgi:hypothetical protein
MCSNIFDKVKEKLGDVSNSVKEGINNITGK